MRLSEYGSVACVVERPTRETQAEQYSDTVLIKSLGMPLPTPPLEILLLPERLLWRSIFSAPTPCACFVQARKRRTQTCGSGYLPVGGGSSA